jgi:pyruvate/2-oxoglutarate/acetoin dehydrogenase E1 component
MKMSIRDAVRETLAAEMERDPRVFLIGEDIAGSLGTTGKIDSWGGAMRVQRGLATRFGRSRIVDTPISETAFLGAAAGAANYGMRPVAEIMFVDFFGVCFDQVLNNIAKFRYQTGGQVSTPLTIRTNYGAGIGGGPQHSQTLYSLFTHIPGIKVVAPSNAADAKGLLTAAIRDDDPVIVFEHRMLYDLECEVPEGDYVIEFGKASVLSDGDDVTVVAMGRMVHVAKEALADLSASGVHGTLIDPRSLAPLDVPTIARSVSKTGRLVVMTEENPRSSVARDIVAAVAEELPITTWRSKPRIVSPPHVPVPFAKELEAMYIPDKEKLKAAVLASVKEAN